MVYEKNGALKSTYYYFGWEELNHFIPLCASFLHFDEPIGARCVGDALTKPKDSHAGERGVGLSCIDLCNDAAAMVPRCSVVNNVTYL